MAVEIVTSWRTLFMLAGRCGKAGLAVKADPSPENWAAYNEAVAAHDEYMQICLKADRMIDSPDLRGL